MKIVYDILNLCYITCFLLSSQTLTPMKDLFRPFIGFREIKVVHKGSRRVSLLISLFLTSSEKCFTYLESLLLTYGKYISKPAYFYIGT